ncbi:hypothetical protein BVAVS116_E0030 (plasmid) [Borreliella valaisiana VS116]|uniref:Uncharacterized protein n=1 Tax=Borreliella valaisiana VS116 TaxID=445987 RepID=C0R8R1_BORVA|nr:hypothetical protein BVAVS116_E0030 [Borreliella valaisiana VS116]
MLSKTKDPNLVFDLRIRPKSDLLLSFIITTSSDSSLEKINTLEINKNKIDNIITLIPFIIILF